jgi:Transglutaminase-like superfamily
MTSAWQRFQGLSRYERSVFLRACFLLPVFACVLRFVGLRRIERLIGSRRRGDGVSTIDNAQKWRIADAARRMTNAASRYGITRGNCLSKSIVLWHLLRCEGLDVILCVGGRKEATRFEAHAWIELDDIAVNDSQDVRERFAPFGDEIGAALSEEK